jgi:predicted enzyme related to lactoylglutathione lyase
MRVNYAIIFVSDMKKSVAFYRDVIGLPLKFETPHWTEFATDGATWALHAADAPNPDSAPDEHFPAGRCKSGFQVDGLDAFHDRMTRKSVACLQQPTEIHGVRIAQYVDPDGMVFAVSEAATGA